MIPPPRFQSLRVEGPDHGPTSFRYEDLQAGEDGRLQVTIPRKALLQIGKPPAEPLTVTVYDPHAKVFEKPVVTIPAARPDGVKIPAGELLISLAASGHAPDLHLLAVQPGEVARLEYTPRAGWSLAVRCIGSKDRKPLKASTVSLESVQGYGVPNQPVGEKKTGVDGLALFPGLAGRTVDAAVQHSEYVTHKAQGLSAVPGTLAFREVVLEEGGKVRAKVRVAGRAQEGAHCKLIDPEAAENSRKIYEGLTDREGICSSGNLAAGSYLLFAVLPQERGTLSRSVVVTNGSETEEELAFSEIRVSGKVSRGDDPVPGFTIRTFEANEELGGLIALAEGTSGEDGTYEITLWKPGTYEMILFRSPEIRMPVVRKSLLLEAGEEAKTVDFALERTAIRGKVVDQEGKPLEKAGVILHLSGAGERYAITDEKGEFEILLDTRGSGDVKARKPGYRESQPQDIALAGETELPPVTLVLAKEKLFRGVLSSAAGLPVPGGWVGVVRSYYGDEPIRPSEGRTDTEGRFEVAPVGEGRNRFFASGPDCPLSFFEPSNEAGDLVLRCQGQPATLDLTLTDLEGRPVPEASVILRQAGVIVPGTVLYKHLTFLGVRPTTDASGRLVIPNLAPGSYDLFLTSSVSEGMIESGSRTGYLTSVRLTPLNTTELKLTVGGQPVKRGPA
ncbi:MAG TPA: carboxypeptidase-like regulatory domain-containing protein [Thermoanaerobaculia bacterium]